MAQIVFQTNGKNRLETRKSAGNGLVSTRNVAELDQKVDEVVRRLGELGLKRCGLC